MADVTGPEVTSGTPVPPWVRAAGLGAGLQGIASFVLGAVLLATGAALGVWGFLVLFGLGVAATGVALARGARGARAPVVVVQLLGLGLAYYAAVPSGRPEWGFPAALLCAGILAGILNRAGREWGGA